MRFRTGALAVCIGAAALTIGCGGEQPGVDLQITGPFSAHLLGNQASCSPAPAGEAPGTIASFAVLANGQPYDLQFLTSRIGAGTYAVSVAGTFVAFNGDGPGWSTLDDHSGDLVVNRDGRSGTLNVALSSEPGSTSAPIHISGSWRCPA